MTIPPLHTARPKPLHHFRTFPQRPGFNCLTPRPQPNCNREGRFFLDSPRVASPCQTHGAIRARTSSLFDDCLSARSSSARRSNSLTETWKSASSCGYAATHARTAWNQPITQRGPATGSTLYSISCSPRAGRDRQLEVQQRGVWSIGFVPAFPPPLFAALPACQSSSTSPWAEPVSSRQSTSVVNRISTHRRRCPSSCLI